MTEVLGLLTLKSMTALFGDVELLLVASVVGQSVQAAPFRTEWSMQQAWSRRQQPRRSGWSS